PLPPITSSNISKISSNTVTAEKLRGCCGATGPTGTCTLPGDGCCENDSVIPSVCQPGSIGGPSPDVPLLSWLSGLCPAIPPACELGGAVSCRAAPYSI